MATINKLITLKLKRRILNNCKLTKGFRARDSCTRNPISDERNMPINRVRMPSPTACWVRRSKRNTNVLVIANSSAAPR